VILKTHTQNELPADPRQRAGIEAERQLAHYLHREFAQDPGVFVLHDLRIVDAEQPEHDGSPGVAQMDCLIIHRLGMFIVESKSVSGTLTVQPDGHGGDQWKRGSQGMESPILQAHRQAGLLRLFLQRHRERLLGKAALGLRTLTKVLAGTDQRGFTRMPIQLLVAISDHGEIRQLRGWKPPREPFRTFLCKADTVPTHIRTELVAHRSSAPLLSTSQGDYGAWSMSEDEAKSVAQFLVEHHSPLRAEAPRTRPSVPPQTSHSTAPSRQQSSPPTVSSTVSVCKHCSSANLTAHSGQFGYYWKCGACAKNTAMPTVCAACGAKGDRGRGVKIRKEGAAYYRDCGACGVSDRVC